jgi:hypothetical protein
MRACNYSPVSNDGPRGELADYWSLTDHHLLEQAGADSGNPLVVAVVPAAGAGAD